MTVVAFDYQAWVARYPEFSGTVAAPLANALFIEAQLYCDNSDCSIVSDASVRAVLLNMLVAHIAMLNVGTGAQPASQLVGRVNSASEGSVSVQATMGDETPGSAAWFQQTKYGAAFWAASMPYRQGLYLSGPQRDMDPFFPGVDRDY